MNDLRALAGPESTQFLVDQCQSWSPQGDELVVRGCVLHPKAQPIIRAHVAAREFRAEVQPVATALEQGTPALAFNVRVKGAPGPHVLRLEVQDERGWNEFFSRSISFPVAPLQASLDEPAPGEVFAGVMRFAGWCMHPQLVIVDLQIRLGDVLHPCRFGLNRDDVAQAFPDIANSRRSGFEAMLATQPGEYHVSLHGFLEDGSELEYAVPRPIVVRPRPVSERIVGMLSRVHGGREVLFAGYALTRIRRWYAVHRRLPGRQEFARLPRWLARQYREYHKRGHVPGMPGGLLLPMREHRYESWLRENRYTASDADALVARLATFGDRLPLLSIVMPVYDPPREYFEAAVASVQAQVFERWELCIADDASTAAWVAPRLRELARVDHRIKFTLRGSNGNISAASNSAAALATGDFLLFLDQDDLLSPDAAGEIVCALAQRADADVLYSDDDKIDGKGERLDPQFKPAWSPELLLSYMYLSHAFCVRRSLFEELGGFRAGFEGSQDYDLALRVTERARRVEHLPIVLYHWRVLPGSTAMSGDAKPAGYDAGRRALAEALARRGSTCTRVYRPEWAEQGKVGIYTHDFPHEGPKVSVIIPSRNNRAVLARCIDSLRHTRYRDYEVVIVDNASDNPETLAYLRATAHRVLTIPNPARAFNFAYINNRAVAQVDGDYVLFLNDDTEVIDAEWLSQMVGHAQLGGVGAVGARLLYADGRVQHAGVVHGYYHGLVGPAFKLMPAWDNGYLSYAAVVRNYSAVTAACMLTPRALFQSVGGFDEEHFAVAYNDVDYCYRLADKGYRCVYAPRAELRHHEGASRGFVDDPREVVAFRTRYRAHADRYYSPQLSLEDEQFRIRPRRYVRRPPERPIRAVMCAFNLNLGGAPYCQYELTLALAQRGILQPTVYSPTDGPLRSLYEKAGIPVTVFEHPLADVFGAEEYERGRERFAHWLREMSFDLVYGNTLQTFYAIDSARSARLPSIWNIRESESWRSYFDFLPAAFRARPLQCFGDAGVVIFVSDAGRAVFDDLDTTNNFQVIHDGLDLDHVARTRMWTRDAARAELHVAAEDIVVLIVGTVCERKGQHDLALAMANVSTATAARVRCFVVGDRPSAYSSRLHRLVAALPPDRAARFSVVDETDQAALYYAAADIFVCTSRIESYPRVILEGMVFDLPIITTPCFGVVEQVRPGVNADFYEAGNTAQLAQVLEALVTDEARRMRYAGNARLVFDSLTSFAEMAEQYAQAFIEVFEAHQPEYAKSAPMRELVVH